MKKLKRIFLWTATIIMILIALALWILPPLVEKSRNRVSASAHYPITKQAMELHKKLLIADGHADSLLWNRNLLKRGTYGHVDMPRLVEGNVALQAFAIVTKSPRNQNIFKNDDTSDNIKLLALIQRWPIPAWWNLKRRALYQARKLHHYAEQSNGKFVLIQTAADLKNYLERRKDDPSLCAGYLGIEGAHALEGDLQNLDVFYDAGIRMISPTHFFDNDMAGSAHGIKQGGVTAKGKEMIARMEAKHMLIDLAHASKQTIADTLALVKKPVIVSHTGVSGTCPNPRNLTDEQLAVIAQTGGVICIGYWDEAVCGQGAQAIARSIKHAVKIAGIKHVGLGSDFDGGTTVPFTADRLAELTAALLEQGFTESEIEMIMGGNLIRLLAKILP